MKAAIVYYSQTGHTDATAKKLAKLTGAELVRIAPKEEYKATGLGHFLDGGKATLRKDLTELMPYQFDAAAYDTVIIGTPAWAAGMAAPVRTFLEAQKEALRGKRIALFAGCFVPVGANKAMDKMAELLGTTPVARLVVVDGKEEKADFAGFAKAVAE